MSSEHIHNSTLAATEDSVVGPLRRATVASSSSDHPITLETITNVTDEPGTIDGASLETSPTSPTSASILKIPKSRRPRAIYEVKQEENGKGTITGAYYFDPRLRRSLLTVPHAVTATANATLTGIGAFPHQRFNQTIGAPIDGLAKLAKQYIVPPDAVFETESGGIDLKLAVVDQDGADVAERVKDDDRRIEKGGDNDRGQPASHVKTKGRTQVRIEVISKKGGIKLDIIELDPNRQIDLYIETKSGDVLVFLPETFHGPVHVTSPRDAPNFLPILSPQVQPVANPYGSFYTTFILPLSLARDPKKSKSNEHTVMRKIAKHVPKKLREQSEYFDMAQAGYAAYSRAEQSKITVQTEKGRVVLGYRETADELTVGELGLVVGPQAPKKWWKF